MDNIDKKVINIDYPCIQDIVMRKGETDICFTVTDGQDETKLFLKDGEDVMFTVNYGDVSNIGFGGTDNWGKDRLPLYVAFEKNSVDYDSVLVDTIEIQTLAGDGDWCKCELINGGKNVKYTALSENPYDVTRTAYFYHKTQDDTVKRGYNAGRPTSKEWCVTVIQDANPNGKPIVVECNGETVGYASGGAVSSAETSSKVLLAQWSKNDECPESWAVDKSRNVSGDSFIDLDSITFDADGKIRGLVNSTNPTEGMRKSQIPTKLGDFQDYFTVYQKAGEVIPTPDPVPPIGTDVNIYVKITNKSKNAVALNGELQFLLANPDKDGNYHGWQGVYNRTDAIIFSDSIITFNSGESKLFKNIKVPEIGGRSLVTADLAATTKYKTNVLLYGTSNNFDDVPVDNMPSDFYFTNNGTYEIVISSNEPPEPSTGITFDEIINVMNPVLKANGFKQVSSSSTPKAYNYLKGMYDAALAEWDDPNSKLFSKETYPELYDYHGNNTEYKEVARTAMLSWIIAMCLTELAPNSGQLTNAQTQYFYKAYNLAGGRNIPLYGDYDMRSDVMIARFAAGAVYALKRGTYTFNDVNVFRNEIGGSAINASGWSGLGYYSPDYKSIGKVGYVVNSDAIIPSGPGPYTDDSDPNRPKPFEEGQPDSQFYMENHNENWYLYNYKKDVEIDNYITSNYNMGSYTYDESKGYGAWEAYDKDKRLLLIHAAVMPIATDHYFFGSRRVKFAGVKYDTKYNFWKYNFDLSSEEVTKDNNVFDVTGPFAEFESKLFYGQYGVTSTMEFIQNVMDMADNSRFPTYHTEYGRRRPLGGVTPGTARAGEINGHPLNGMLNSSIARFFADSQKGYDKYTDCDDFPHDGPRTYPSGHAAMTWTDAMLFAQMFANKDKAIEFMKAAYKIGVGRTVGRFHWTSDTLYGRLFATFIMPLINAMNGGNFQSQYESAKNVLVNGGGEGDYKVKLYINNQTGKAIQSTGEIRLYVDNHIGVNTYLPGAMPSAGALYTFNVGMNDFSSFDVHCVMNGESYMSDEYNGKAINEIRFYDYRHWNSTDCGWKVSLDSGSDTTIKKSGATYILKVENL